MGSTTTTIPRSTVVHADVDDRLRELERGAVTGSDGDRLRWFAALHRAGKRVPISLTRQDIQGRFLERVHIELNAVSEPRARVPVEFVLLMNIGDKQTPLEALDRWTGRFTFRFREDSDEGPAKLKLATMQANGPKIEGCRVFNVWTGDPVYLTWHKSEDGLPDGVPWLIDVVVNFDPQRAR